MPAQRDTVQDDLLQEGSTILAADQGADDPTPWAERIAGWCREWDRFPFLLPAVPHQGRAFWCFLQTRLHGQPRPEFNELWKAGLLGWDPTDWRRDIAYPPLPGSVTLTKPHDR